MSEGNVDDLVHIGNMPVQVEDPQVRKVLHHGVDMADRLRTIDTSAGEEERDIVGFHVVEQGLQGLVINGKFGVLAETERQLEGKPGGGAV